ISASRSCTDSDTVATTGKSTLVATWPNGRWVSTGALICVRSQSTTDCSREPLSWGVSLKSVNCPSSTAFCLASTPEKQQAAGDVRKVRRAQQGGEHGQIAAPQRGALEVHRGLHRPVGGGIG